MNYLKTPKSSGDHRKVPKISFENVTFVSFNARRRWETTFLVLESMASSVDVILFQEPGWKGVHSQPSSTNKDGEMACGPPIHPSWKPLMEVFDPTDSKRPRPRVLIYINNRMEQFKPQLRTDIIKHQDVTICTMHIKCPNYHVPREFNMMNVYNDSNNTALGVLELMEERFPPIAICAGDFNIQDLE
jgi:hypothetical protein